MNVILIMIDSLNRNYLSPYGGNIKTPNFERLAKRCVTMERHWTGSLPTMPCRHEVLTGRHEYLWRGWGPLEPYDMTIPQLMTEKELVSMMITDTYHYFQEGAGNYHMDFTGWEFFRGHETDNWITAPVDDPPRLYGAALKEKPGKAEIFMRNTMRFRDERDFFSPRLFSHAAGWLDDNHTHKNFFLMIDSFDVHEPFHVPPPYDTMYDPDFTGEWPIWNNYGFKKDFDPKVLKHIRAQYMGKITMLDKWLGLVLDRLDRYNLWENSLVLLTSDHGHHMGEFGWVGKNRSPYHTILTHIPLLVSFPGMKPRPGSRSKLLTSQVDMYPTIIEALGLKIPKKYTVHGYSMLPALRGKEKKVRDIAHTGYFGNEVVITDGRYVLHKTPVNKDNQPLYEYGLHLEHFHKRSDGFYRDTEIGQFLPYTDLNVFRKRTKKRLPPNSRDLLFDLKVGDQISKNISRKQPALVKKLERKLVDEFSRIQAPEEHFERLGLGRE